MPPCLSRGSQMTGSTSQSKSVSFWHETASTLSIEGRALIDGLLVEARSGAQRAAGLE